MKAEDIKAGERYPSRTDAGVEFHVFSVNPGTEGYLDDQVEVMALLAPQHFDNRIFPVSIAMFLMMAQTREERDAQRMLEPLNRGDRVLVRSMGTSVEHAGEITHRHNLSYDVWLDIGVGINTVDAARVRKEEPRNGV